MSSHGSSKKVMIFKHPDGLGTEIAAQNELELCRKENEEDPDGDGPESTKKIFVGGLAWTTTSEILTEYFSKFGPVKNSYIIMDTEEEKSRGFGFVEFVSPKSVALVLKQSHFRIDGRSVECKPSYSRYQATSYHERRVKVSGLPATCQQKRVMSMFAEVGKIEHVEFDCEQREGKCIAYVTYSGKSGISKCLERTDWSYDGKPLKVSSTPNKDGEIPSPASNRKKGKEDNGTISSKQSNNDSGSMSSIRNKLKNNTGSNCGTNSNNGKNSTVVLSKRKSTDEDSTLSVKSRSKRQSSSSKDTYKKRFNQCKNVNNIDINNSNSNNKKYNVVIPLNLDTTGTTSSGAVSPSKNVSEVSTPIRQSIFKSCINGPVNANATNTYDNSDENFGYNIHSPSITRFTNIFQNSDEPIVATHPTPTINNAQNIEPLKNEKTYSFGSRKATYFVPSQQQGVPYFFSDYTKRENPTSETTKTSISTKTSNRSTPCLNNGVKDNTDGTITPRYLPLSVSASSNNIFCKHMTSKQKAKSSDISKVLFHDNDDNNNSLVKNCNCYNNTFDPYLGNIQKNPTSVTGIIFNTDNRSEKRFGIEPNSGRVSPISGIYSGINISFDYPTSTCVAEGGQNCRNLKTYDDCEKEDEQKYLPPFYLPILESDLEQDTSSSRFSIFDKDIAPTRSAINIRGTDLTKDTHNSDDFIFEGPFEDAAQYQWPADFLQTGEGNAMMRTSFDQGLFSLELPGIGSVE